MRKMSLILGSIVVLMIFLAACSGSQPADDVMSGPTVITADEPAEDMADEMPEETSDEMSDDMSNDMSNDMSSDDSMTEDSSGDMADNEMADSSHDTMEDNQQDESQETSDPMTEPDDSAPAWVRHQFTDATTGQSFSISDFKGKVVLVETMAMWCSNCMKQQIQVKELHSLLGEREDFQSIGIDVDPNEDLARLSTYVDRNGFDWLYGVAPPEVLSGIQESLGGQFLNPPSTPIVLFDKEGNYHPLPFGIKSANDLLNFVEQYLN